MNERKRRPTLQRTAPIRDWRGVFGPAATPRQEGGTSEREPREGHGVEDAIARSVEVGYRVIDDYIRQGERAARDIREGRLTTESLVRDTADLGGRMARYASDFVGAWMQLLEVAAANGNGAPQQAPADAPEAPRPRAREEATATTRIALVVTADRVTETRLEVDELREGAVLLVHALRSADQRAPRIEDVVVTRGEGTEPPVVSVGIPAGHPEGVYEGLVIDEATNVPVGVLRVTIPRTP